MRSDAWHVVDIHVSALSTMVVVLNVTQDHLMEQMLRYLNCVLVHVSKKDEDQKSDEISKLATSKKTTVQARWLVCTESITFAAFLLLLGDALRLSAHLECV